jgi:hypothetical protein
VLRAQGKAQASIHCAKDELQYVPGTFLTNSGRLLVSVTRVKMAPLQLIQNRLLLTLRGRLRLGRAAGYQGTSPREVLSSPPIPPAPNRLALEAEPAARWLDPVPDGVLQ